LCLDDRHLAAERIVRSRRFLPASSDRATRHGNARVPKNLLGLKFVDFHGVNVGEL
jgi:hypothetical protein